MTTRPTCRNVHPLLITPTYQSGILQTQFFSILQPIQNKFPTLITFFLNPPQLVRHFVPVFLNQVSNYKAEDSSPFKLDLWPLDFQINRGRPKSGGVFNKGSTLPRVAFVQRTCLHPSGKALQEYMWCDHLRQIDEAWNQTRKFQETRVTPFKIVDVRLIGEQARTALGEPYFRARENFNGPWTKVRYCEQTTKQSQHSFSTWGTKPGPSSPSDHRLWSACQRMAAT